MNHMLSDITLSSMHTLSSLESIADSIEIISDVQSKTTDLMDIVEGECQLTETQTNLYNHILDEQRHRIVDSGMLLIDDPESHAVSVESVKEFFQKAGRAIYDFLKKMIAKIKDLLGFGKKNTEKAKEKAKADNQDLKVNPIAQKTYEVPMQLLGTILRGTDIKKEYKLSELTPILKSSTDLIDEYNKKVLTIAIPMLATFEQALKSSWFLNLNYDSPQLSAYKNSPNSVSLMIRKSLKIADTREEALSTVKQSVNVFDSVFQWEHWDQEVIFQDNPNQAEKISLSVDTDALVEINNMLSGAFYQESSMLLAKIDACNDAVNAINEAHAKFLGAFQAKKAGKYWTPSRVKDLNKIIQEMIKVCRVNARLANYTTRIADDVNRLNDYLRKASNRED